MVPYNPILSRTFVAHINDEYFSSVYSIKYICKYVNKGSDQASFDLENENDEIKSYYYHIKVDDTLVALRLHGEY